MKYSTESPYYFYKLSIRYFSEITNLQNSYIPCVTTEPSKNVSWKKRFSHDLCVVCACVCGGAGGGVGESELLCIFCIVQ